jgi:hypothetical protein
MQDCTLIPVGTRPSSFRSAAPLFASDEQYFLLLTAPDDVPFGQLVRQTHRHEGIIATRWWSLREITCTPKWHPPEA